MKKTASKKASAPAIPFGQWVKEIARARGAEGELVKELRADKRITVKSSLARAQELHGVGPFMESLKNRYGQFAKRGSQAKKAA